MVGWFLVLGTLSTVTAAPSIVFPVNSQVPPVARASKPFQFTFAQSTFASGATSINYALSGAPGWLQLDSASRSMYGTPGPQDVGPTTLNLLASDDTGSSVMPVTLVVSADPGPAVGKPVADQLSAYGALSNPQGLVLPYSSPIALSFSPDTFTNTDRKTVYYALCANNTPLPSWINFNSNSLSFSGTTPQSTSPAELSQVYDILFTASDVVGFAGAIASFQLVVENHIFIFNSGSNKLDVTPGVLVNYSGLQTSLTLDHGPMQSSDLGQIEANTPSWMSLDQHTLVLSGIPPADVSPLNFTVLATDKYGDQASTTICLITSGNASGTLLPNQLNSVNATIGSTFAYSLAGKTSSDLNVQMSVDLSDAPWLAFEPTTRFLQGNVPSSLKPGQVLLNVTATNKTDSQSATLTINIVQAGINIQGQSTGGPSVTSINVSPTSTGGTHTAAASRSDDERQKKGRMAAAVILPLLAALAFLLLLCWCRRRRRMSRQGYMQPTKEQISRPLPLSWVRRVSIIPPLTRTRRRESHEHRTIAEQLYSSPRDSRPTSELGTIIHEKRTSTKPPKLSFLRLSQPRWSHLGVPKERIAALEHRVSEPVYQLAPEDQERLSYGTKSTSRKRRSSRISEEVSIFDDAALQRCSAKRKRQSTTSMSSAGAPFGHRISGFGHGRNGLSQGSSLVRGRSVIGFGHGSGGPPGHGPIRYSWRSEQWLSTTGSSSSRCLGSEHSQNLASNVPWPRPPTSTNLNPFSRTHTIREASSDDDDHTHRLTIRRVLSTSDDPWPARQNYVERRARNRHRDNALFAAKASSRTTSQHLPSYPLLTTALNNKENTAPTSTRSRSSSLSHFPLKPSPVHRHPRRSNFPTSDIRVLSPSRFRSNASPQSSRFGDAESSGPPSPSPELNLREEVDEQGRKRWRHVEYPNPLGSNSVGDEGERAAAAGGREMGDEMETLFNAREGSQAVRLSQLREGREGGGVQRRAVLGSGKAKRPVSVPNVGALRAAESFRGEVGAFI